MAIPTGPCWSPISLTAPVATGPSVPAGAGDGDRLVWLNGAWVSTPTTTGKTSPDTIYGHRIDGHILTEASLLASGLKLDYRTGYFNKDAGAVFVYDPVTGHWVVHQNISGDEFVDLKTGNVYTLSPLSQNVPCGPVLDATISAIVNGKPNPLVSATPRQYTVELGDGINKVFQLNHGLGTINIHVTVTDVVTHQENQAVTARWTDENTVTLSFINPPSLNSQRVVVTTV